MKNNKLNHIVALATVGASFLIGANSSWAATSIGASFVGRNADPADLLAPADSAGVVPQASWNNVRDDGSTFTGKSAPLQDSAGNFTAVTLVYIGSDSWSSDGPTVTPNDKLMKGILKANPTPDIGATNGSDTITLVLTNLPVGTYDVIVYATENGTGAKVAMTQGATTYYFEEQASFDGTFVAATNIDSNTYELGPNYARYNGVAAVNGAIKITAVKFIEDPQIADGIGIAGIQIIPNGATTWPSNTAAITITKDPVSTLAVEGGTAQFNVSIAGPGFVKWQKNGVDIAGATGTTLTINPVLLADNNAVIKAVVYNNVVTNTSAGAILSVDANTPPVLTQGFLKVDRWENIGGNTGLGGLDDLRAAILAGGPTISFFVGSAAVPNSNPDISNFGARLTGWMKPDVTGDYDFFIRSDDSSALFINSVAAASGTNALPDYSDATAAIVNETGCCAAFLEPDLATRGQTTGANSPSGTGPIHLEAGKLYGMVILYKEGGGGDFVQVAWRKTTDTTPAASLQPIAGVNLYTMASSAGQRATITLQPLPVTVVEDRDALFKFGVATTPVAGTFSIQWLTNGVVVPNAGGTTLKIVGTTLAQNNTTVQARALTLTGVLNSDIVKLTVIADTFPPVPIPGAITRAADNVIEIGVAFDEPVNNAGLIAGNFSLSAGTITAFTVVTNSLATYANVLLTTSGLTAGGTYQVTVKNVADKRGNAITTTNVSVTVGSSGWANTGTPIRPGQVVPVGKDGFDVLNGGRQEWGSYDEATIAFVKKTNDFDVKVQVIYAEPASEWARCGLMARNALDINEPADDRNNGTSTASAYAQTHVNPNQTFGSSGVWDTNAIIQPANQTPNNGHEQNQRLATGGATSGWGSPGTSPVYPDVWLRLSRSGDTLHGYRSEDGVVWVDQGTTTLTDTTNVMYVGPFFAVETGNIWAAADFDVWAAPFDPLYDRLFVGQFRNFGDVVSSVLPTISGTRNAAGQFIITYTGTLTSSTTANGTYTDVGGATSPYTIPNTSTGNAFFRSRN